MQTVTRLRLVAGAQLVTTLDWGLPAVTFVRQVSMILIRRLLLHARAARWASTLQRGRHYAATVRRDMRTKTVIRRRLVAGAQLGTFLQQGTQIVRSAQPVSMILTLILQLRARNAMQVSTLQRGRALAVTVQLDMQTRTVIRLLLARGAMLDFFLDRPSFLDFQTLAHAMTTCS